MEALTPRGARSAYANTVLTTVMTPAVLDDVADMAAPRSDRGHRGDVIGLKHMLHAEEKAEA
jgi:hypothetical protein